MRLRTGWIAAGISVLAAIPVSAEEADERVIVTATRQSEALSGFAGSITPIDADEVALIAPDHVSEVLNRAPGVFIHRGNGQEHLTAIRSPVLTGGAGAGSFLYLEDGVPMRAAGFANVNGLFEAMTELSGGLEIVRGPGSVLYGSNAVHGLVNVLTPAPSEAWERRLTVRGGSFGRVSGQALLSGSEGAHGFVAGLDLSHEGGWRDDAGVDQQKALLRWDYQAGDVSIRTSLAAHNLNQETAGFIRGADAYKNSALSRTNPSPHGFRDAKAVRLQSRIDWRRSEELTLSVTPYARWNEMTFSQHFLPSDSTEENGHKSVGVLSAAYWSFEGGHSLIIGADAELTDGYLSEVQERPTFGSFPQGVHYNFDVTSAVLAGYVQGEYWLGPRLKVTGGVRLEGTKYDYTNNAEDNAVGRHLRPADRTDDYLTATPKLGLTYQLEDDMALYTRYARGSRAPQVTDLYRLQINQQVGDIEVETLDSIEAGLRGAWSGISYDLAIYAADKDNFFFRDTDGFNVPDGKTRHLGFEFDLYAPLTERFAIAATGAYARHTYRFDNTVSVNSTESILKGDDVDTAPRTVWNIRAIWTPLDSVTAELEWSHVGAYFMDASNSQRYPGHEVFNLRGQWQVNDAVQLFAGIRNLTNTDYANRADFSFGSERYFPGEDRSFSGGVTLRF